MTNPRSYFKLILILPVLYALAACSTNQATGRSQFTGLMSEGSEAGIGAQEHDSILAQYGGAVNDKRINDYVTGIGQSIVPHTERKDVNYTFTLLDTPVVNAFALPGGYVYVTRGILALANNEAELAGVISHEIGHVTARHSAERYSTSVVTGLGANLIAAAVNIDGVGQALGLGANLYLSSYSRSQEHEADDLGVRYLSRAGYDTLAMSDFLTSLEASTKLKLKEAGKDGDTNTPSYFSTHPVTAERIAQSASAAAQYPDNEEKTNRSEYLRMVNGLVVGDSPKQGFVDDGVFVHPDLGFSFKIPKNYKTENTAKAFIAQKNGAKTSTMIFTSGKKQAGQSISEYLRQNVLKGDMSKAKDFGTNSINGFNVASFESLMTISNVKTNTRVVAFEWDNETVYQFMVAMPINTPQSEILDLQDTVFSFKRLTNTEKRSYRPKTITIRVAKQNDTAETMSRNFPYDDDFNADRFRVLNGMKEGAPLLQRNAYKVIVQ